LKSLAKTKPPCRVAKQGEERVLPRQKNREIHWIHEWFLINGKYELARESAGR